MSQMWSHVGLGFQSAGPGWGWAEVGTGSWAVLGIWWFDEHPSLASAGDWGPAGHLLHSLGTPVTSGITQE